MIDPKTGHDWSEQPKPGFKDYVPRCHRCSVSSADKEKAAERCLGAPLIRRPQMSDQGKALGWWQCSCGTEIDPKHGQCPECGGFSDSRRLDHLDELLRNCPHAQITFCDDPDEVEAHALGWGIRVEGCQTSEVYAPTFREVIDKDILASNSNPPASSGEG
jgi:hypothetical protein